MSATAIEAVQQAGSKPSALIVRDWVREHRLGLLITAGLFLLLYGLNFVKLASDWWNDPNYSHGFLVPVAFFWMVWQKREELGNAPRVPQTWGLGVVILGLLQLIAGTWGAENFVAHSSMLVVLTGMTLFLFGVPVMRLILFPVAWLVFMIPLPSIIFYSVTFPLQLVASRLAGGILDLLRVPNVIEGNVIYLANFTAGVVEACSGIRSLISLLAFAVLAGHFLSMKTWARWALAISAIPIALGVNSMRVAITGLLGNYLGSEWAEGFFHTFSGWLLFVGALVAMFGVAQLLRRLNGVAPTGRAA
ncbi:MAG TPA: exosortase [Terriglobales bacterium]|jgi:exosortase|nr:exosortase [Terriglobales bacterium]